MGTKLIPALHTKNSLRPMAKCFALTGSHADALRCIEMQTGKEELVEKNRSEAMHGNTDAANELAASVFKGRERFIRRQEVVL
uniref:Uncharacterized protein n=1 Tax=viral metagenome TaxID=1070528 RepID=A0A6C0C372_9ZZZZ